MNIEVELMKQDSRLISDFSEVLFSAIEGCGRNIELDINNVPSSYERAIRSQFENCQPETEGKVIIYVRSPDYSDDVQEILGVDSVLAEFPFNRSERDQRMYLNAYMAEAAIVHNNNMLIREFLSIRRELIISGQSNNFAFPLEKANICCDGVALDKNTPTLQLPGGEVFIKISNGFGDGTVEVDLSISNLPNPWLLYIKKGHICSLEPLASTSPQKRSLANIFELEGAKVVELGFGTNPNATALSYGCLFEKVLGSMHLGLDILDEKQNIMHIDVPILSQLPASLSDMLIRKEVKQ